MFIGDTFPAAKTVELYAVDGAVTFGASLGGSKCWKGTKRCTGSTAPLKRDGRCSPHAMTRILSVYDVPMRF